MNPIINARDNLMALQAKPNFRRFTYDESKGTLVEVKGFGQWIIRLIKNIFTAGGQDRKIHEVYVNSLIQAGLDPNSDHKFSAIAIKAKLQNLDLKAIFDRILYSNIPQANTEQSDEELPPALPDIVDDDLLNFDIPMPNIEPAASPVKSINLEELRENVRSALNVETFEGHLLEDAVREHARASEGNSTEKFTMWQEILKSLANKLYGAFKIKAQWVLIMPVTYDVLEVMEKYNPSTFLDSEKSALSERVNHMRLKLDEVDREVGGINAQAKKIGQLRDTGINEFNALVSGGASEATTRKLQNELDQKNAEYKQKLIDLRQEADELLATLLELSQ